MYPLSPFPAFLSLFCSCNSLYFKSVTKNFGKTSKKVPIIFCVKLKRLYFCTRFPVRTAALYDKPVSLPEASYEDFSCRMSPVTVTFRTESATGTRLPRPSFMSLVFGSCFFVKKNFSKKKFRKNLEWNDESAYLCTRFPKERRSVEIFERMRTRRVVQERWYSGHIRLLSITG